MHIAVCLLMVLAKSVAQTLQQGRAVDAGNRRSVDKTMAAPKAHSSREFSAQVSPLLKQYCSRCHGPDEPEAGLRVDVLNPDLLGLDLDFAGKLPPEGTAKEGFTNNSLVLITSMLHVEYFQATSFKDSTGELSELVL